MLSDSTEGILRRLRNTAPLVGESVSKWYGIEQWKEKHW
jgi:hypothetical protein